MGDIILVPLGFEQAVGETQGDDLSKGGAAVKFRVSSTTLTYGDQMPALPVL
ncbi:OprD family outer membrane porin, partial [Pseudomonas mandelii]|uniref:OprD family outer membrane porin n=1 Tax=Pseudomonas mandelii TaxID=75612 RepID=UPI003D087BED